MVKFVNKIDGQNDHKYPPIIHKSPKERNSKVFLFNKILMFSLEIITIRASDLVFISIKQNIFTAIIIR